MNSSTLVHRLRKASDGTSKVVTNPRISAGSTVVITGSAAGRICCSRNDVTM